MKSTMQGYVLRKPGGPDALELTELPAPEPRPGWVTIAVRAFGLNRSEWFTRSGDSPSVRLPRVLGIECVGTVIANPGGDLKEGQVVAAMMGGMGRQFDGSYAEVTQMDATLPVSSIDTHRGEMLQKRCTFLESIRLCVS